MTHPDEAAYKNIEHTVSKGDILPLETALQILDISKLDTLSLVALAFQFRFQHFGKSVMLHILNNVQNGLCPEDCRYCVQSTSSEAPIPAYSMKSDEEILAEAQQAYTAGAGRYCMVFSGTGPDQNRITHLARLIRTIKERYPIEVCVSPGVINQNQARELKEAGLDRLNHNLNTSEKFYHQICTSHPYANRVQTLEAAHAVGLPVCSGVIVGMGESAQDVYLIARQLRTFGADSIPVNFLIPIPGIALKEAIGLSPEYCLRVLCLFRFLNPSAEIRMAAGREMHLRSLEPLGLYVANSLFLQGYLNAKGAPDIRTLHMIKDAGFSIVSEIPLDGLLKNDPSFAVLKDFNELRPFLRKERTA